MKQCALGEILPYSKNAKRHPKKQIEQIAASIKEFGFNQPIVVDKAGVIIVGHGRYEAAKLLELTTVPVIQLNVSEKHAKAYRLADNKLNESEWDMDLVIEELKELTEPLIELTGFSKDLLLEPDDKDDIVPTGAPARAKTGDLWLLGDHRLLCGDSTKEEHVVRLMDGNKADMVFTDPPYNIGYDGSPDKDWEQIMGDQMSKESFASFLTETFKRMRDSIKTGAGSYIFHSPRTQDAFMSALAVAGFEIKQQMIWNKPSQVPGMGDYRSKHEPFFYAVVQGAKAQFYGDRTHTTVWDFQKSEQDLTIWAKKMKRMEQEGKTTIWTMSREPVADYVHPTQKPVELITYALSNSSKEGDIVLDLFLGSGSTLIACEKAGRVCYGMELDPKFVDTIVQRWEDYTGKTATLWQADQPKKPKK